MIEVLDSEYFKGWNGIKEWTGALIEHFKSIADGKAIGIQEAKPATKLEKGYQILHFHYGKDLEKEEILRYIKEYEDQFVTQESKNVPGRMLCQIPAPVVPGLNQIYSTIDLYL